MAAPATSLIPHSLCDIVCRTTTSSTRRALSIHSMQWLYAASLNVRMNISEQIADIPLALSLSLSTVNHDDAFIFFNL